MGGNVPALAFQNVNIFQVGLTVAVGFAFVIYVAWRQREASWKINTFFLGGRNIGAPLSAQTYWGSSFSFANGIIYFAVLAYFYGLSVIWFQVLWVIGIWVLAWRLPQLLEITDRYTLHGFLGSLFGPSARKMASLVTITGFMGFFAYEVAISTEVVSEVLGIKSGVALLSLLVGVYVAAHADVGGYAGTARTDRVQNLLGMIVVILVIYYLIAFPNNFVNRTNLTPSKIVESFFDLSSVPWPIWLGVLSFAPFVNVVDMSHWQTIAANTKGTSTDIRNLKWGIIKSGWWMIIFPAATGAFIGYLWRGVTGIADANILPASIGGLPGQSGELSGFVGGFVILGLLALGFSSAAGYLVASVQTASWDLRHYELIFRDKDQALSEYEERSIVFEARLILYVFAIASLILFLVARHVVGDQKILPLQFVLVGIVVSLFPATTYGLWLNLYGKQANASTSRLMVASIAGGYISGIAIYFKPVILGGDLNDVFQWSPVAALAVSGIIAAIVVVRDLRLQSSVSRDPNADVSSPGGAEK
jgi:Na+/proline symporter